MSAGERVLECYKLHLILEDQNAYRNVDEKDQVQEISVENKDSIGIKVRDHVYDTLAKYLSTFFSYFQTL